MDSKKIMSELDDARYAIADLESRIDEIEDMVAITTGTACSQCGGTNVREKNLIYETRAGREVPYRAMKCLDCGHTWATQQ